MDSTASTEQSKIDSDQNQLYFLVRKYSTVFLTVLVGYVFGNFGLSFAWILLLMLLWVLRCQKLKKNQEKLACHRAIANDEKSMISNALKELPSWVYFPDTERIEWINKILRQLWPFIDDYMKIVLKREIEPSISSSLPNYLKSFRFDKVDLGTAPARFGSVKVYEENTSRNEIILDVEIIYAGNCDIQVRIKGLKAGIKDLQVYGILRVELRPLLKDKPLIGCVSCYFLTCPQFEFKLTNFADILDIPGFSNILKQAIKEQLSAFIVLPNKFVFPLVDNISMESLKFQLPIGIVRLEIIEARNLRKADMGMLGMGKSDPYCNIMVGAQEFRTKVIQNTINPKWNYVCEAIVHHLHGQFIDIEVMDEDQGSKDDFLGRIQLSLSNIASDGVIEAWLKLKETNTGSIHVRATWLTPDSNRNIQDEEIAERKKFKSTYESIIHMFDEKKEQNKASIPAAIAAVSIFLDSAKNLPITNKTSGEPSTFVSLSIGKQKQNSIVKSFTTNPVWEESFYFLIDHLDKDVELRADVVDSRSNKSLGTVVIKLEEVYLNENMSLSTPQPIKDMLHDRNCESKLLITVQIVLLKAPKIIRPLQNLLIEKSFDEPNDEELKNQGIPSLEEMVRGTVQPIYNVTQLGNSLGKEKDLVEESQKTRTSSVKEEDKRESISSQSNRSQIQLTIERATKDKTLITLHKAVNLPKVGNKKPSVYAKVLSSGDSKQKKRKTQILRSTCDPIFEKTFEIESTGDDGKLIEVAILTRIGSNALFSRKNRIIGIAKVDVTSIEPKQQVTDWFDLEQPND